MSAEKIPAEIMAEARVIATAAAGQVCDNEDARCVETLVYRLVESALLTHAKATESRLSEMEKEVERLDRALQFVARWAWRTDPPNANNKLTDAERLSAIKYHPTLKKYAEPHIVLAEAEARRREGGGK